MDVLPTIDIFIFVKSRSYMMMSHVIFVVQEKVPKIATVPHMHEDK